LFGNVILLLCLFLPPDVLSFSSSVLGLNFRKGTCQLLLRQQNGSMKVFFSSPHLPAVESIRDWKRSRRGHKTFYFILGSLTVSRVEAI
jgi:hypothetical protein